MILISRGPLHVPGLPNPRHDPWPATLLPRAALHAGDHDDDVVVVDVDHDDDDNHDHDHDHDHDLS